MQNKHGWEIKKFETCIEKISYTQKIKSNNYLDNGLFPIVSQDENKISGYWNEEKDLLV